MNAAYFHIVLVHLPVVLTPLGATLLLIAHTRHSMTTARVALGILVAAALITVPTFLLGEPAEEIVEHIAGVSEDIIEAHEEAAEVALWLSIASGMLSLLTWRILVKGGALERLFLTLTFLCSLAASATLGYTAHQGGKIRHPEAFTEKLSAESHESSESH
jgi:hypothetical protein